MLGPGVSEVRGCAPQVLLNSRGEENREQHFQNQFPKHEVTHLLKGVTGWELVGAPGEHRKWLRGCEMDPEQRVQQLSPCAGLTWNLRM